MNKGHSNLIPIRDSETAKIMGEIGGRSRSDKKIRAARINAVKHGKTAKDPETIKLITPTAQEKAIGITRDDKIEMYKKISLAAYSDSKKDFFEGMKKEGIEIKTDILRYQKEGKIEEVAKLKMQYFKLQTELGKIKYGLNNITMNQLNMNVNVESVKLADVMQRFNEKEKEIQ